MIIFLIIMALIGIWFVGFISYECDLKDEEWRKDVGLDN